jgi:hypothetical protein
MEGGTLVSESSDFSPVKGKNKNPMMKVHREVQPIQFPYLFSEAPDFFLFKKRDRNS